MEHAAKKRATFGHVFFDFSFDFLFDFYL